MAPAAPAEKDPEARLRLELLEAELALKQAEARSAGRRGSGILSQPHSGLIIGGFVTLITALVANLLQSRMATELERQKLESTLITKAVETLDPDVSSRNLRFLLKSGLIRDPDGKIARASSPAEAPVFSTASGEPIRLSQAQRASFLENYGRTFGPVAPAVEGRLREIFDYLEKNPGISDVRSLAYTLATMKHETAGTFRPLVEPGSDESLERRYGPDTLLGRGLGNRAEGDAARYRGRGYVQVSGRRNYEKVSQALGLAGTPDDLVANPEAMLKPEIAFRAAVHVLTSGAFTGRKLSDYISEEKADYVQARRVVAGGVDQAAPIAEEARKFEQILAASMAQGSIASETVTSR